MHILWQLFEGYIEIRMDFRTRALALFVSDWLAL
jgi:hypothetical protein